MVNFPQIMHKAKGIIRKKVIILSRADVPRDHFTVYVGAGYKKRFVVPIAYLEHPSFQDLLKKAEEEFQFKYPTEGLILPCNEDTFLNVITNMTGY